MRKKINDILEGLSINRVDEMLPGTKGIDADVKNYDKLASDAEEWFDKNGDDRDKEKYKNSKQDKTIIQGNKICQFLDANFGRYGYAVQTNKKRITMPITALKDTVTSGGKKYNTDNLNKLIDTYGLDFRSNLATVRALKPDKDGYVAKKLSVKGVNVKPDQDELDDKELKSMGDTLNKR